MFPSFQVDTPATTIAQIASQDGGANRDASALLLLLQVDNTNDEGAPLGLPDDFAVNNERPTLV